MMIMMVLIINDIDDMDFNDDYDVYEDYDGINCINYIDDIIEFVFNICEETISRTDEGEPRPKYIFNKFVTDIYFFTLQRFGPSPSPSF